MLFEETQGTEFVGDVLMVGVAEGLDCVTVVLGALVIAPDGDELIGPVIVTASVIDGVQGLEDKQ